MPQCSICNQHQGQEEGNEPLIPLLGAVIPQERHRGQVVEWADGGRGVGDVNVIIESGWIQQ